jgi:hypothetical protein
MRSALGIRWTALLVTLLLAAQGCASIGPSHARRDRQDYNLSLTESWKRQILLNVVKIRCLEPLLFVDIGAFTLLEDENRGAPLQLTIPAQ